MTPDPRPPSPHTRFGLGPTPVAPLRSSDVSGPHDHVAWAPRRRPRRRTTHPRVVLGVTSGAFWTVEAVTHMYLNTHDRMLTDRQRLRRGKAPRLLFQCSIGCPSRRFSDRSPRAVATEDVSTPRFRDGERRRRFHGRSRGSRRRFRRLSRVRSPRTARGFVVFHRSDWRDGRRRRPVGPRRGRRRERG